MAVLLAGKPVAEELSAHIRRRAEALSAAGVTPKLVLLRCGENEADAAYIRGALKRAALCGVAAEVRTLPADAPAGAVAAAIDQVNADPAVHGCLLLRPLPPHLRREESALCARLSPDKDVDGMTPDSAAAVYTGQGRGFAPCTAQACLELLHFYHIDPAGKHAVVVGRSPVVGRPAAMLLLRENATVTVCHTKTPDVAALTRQADIIITAAGAANSLTAAHVRPGQTVLDVSVNWNGAALCGDADFPAVEPVVAAITPVPGGVGAVTSTVLMAHTVSAAETLHDLHKKG